MARKQGDDGKFPLSVRITPKANSNLEQLVSESKLGSSDIIDRMLVDYFDSFKKKISV